MAATEREPRDRKWIVEVGEALACAAGFLVLSFLFCYPAGLSSSTCILGGDTLAAYFPYLLRCFQPVSADVAGPWDPTVLTGLPESHSPYGAYYPPTILLYWLFPAAQALSLGLVLHHALAGLGAYVLARTCRLSRSAAWLTGIVFGFGGFMVFHRGHLPIQYSAAWLPWVLWGLERFRTSGSLFWVVASGTLLALHALCAHLQLIVIGGFVWLTYLAYFTVTGPGDCCRPWRFMVGGLSACFLGAAGSLPHVLPVLEIARWSGHGDFNADFFNSGYLRFRFLVGLAGPWVLGGSFGVSSPSGYWGLTEHGIFYGVLPLTAALVAVLRFFSRKGRTRQGDMQAGRQDRAATVRERRRLPLPYGRGSVTVSVSLPTRKEAGFWLVLLGESLVLMLGKTLPVHYVLAYLPIYNFFHMPTRHVWVMGLALAWLAGLGLDLLRNLPETSRKRLLTRLGATMLALAGIYVLLIHSGVWPDRPGWSYPGFWLPGLSALASFGLLICASRVKWFRGWAGALIALLAFVELSFTIRDYELTPLPAEVLTKTSAFPEVISWLRERERGSLPPRCLIRSETWMTKSGPLPVPAGFASAWGLSSLNYYTQSMPRSLMRILQTDAYGSADFGALLAEERGLSAAAGRYILVGGALPLFAPGLGNLEDLPAGLIWKPDDRSPGHPSPLAAADAQKQASTLVASLVTVPGQTYLVEGVLPSQGPRQGTVRIVLTTRRSADILGETTFRPSDYQAGGIHFACLFDSGTLSGSFWITLACPDGQALSPPEIKIWHLTAAYAKSARLADPRQVVENLRADIRQPYPALASFSDEVRVYENPRARPVAGFIREVRPAANDVDAAERITSPGLQVRDLAYVVAPGGRSQDWDFPGPSYFEPGAAELSCRRPDDLTVRTINPGEGFLVLAVTRCVGWSATIDGHKAPIHAVDGPFMGVRVPAGEHTIRFQFRPVLVWAGTAVAVLFLGGAWAGVVIGFVRRRRGVLQVTDSLKPAPGMAA